MNQRTIIIAALVAGAGVAGYCAYRALSRALLAAQQQQAQRFDVANADPLTARTTTAFSY